MWRTSVSAKHYPDDAALLSDWLQREGQYRANSYRGAARPGEILFAKGQSGVLVTASHSVAQVREATRKKPELRTGGLAELVAARSGASALTALASGTGDPNWDREHPFKRPLESLRGEHQIVLDLHGMDDCYGVDVCIGSGSGSALSGPLVETCRASAEAAGLRVTINRPFSASRSSTITSTAQRLGYTAAQLEIAAGRRNPVRAPEESLQLVRWLIEFALTIAW